MQQWQAATSRQALKILALALAGTLLAFSTPIVLPHVAYAAGKDDIASIAKRVEKANDDYDAAVKKVEDVKKRMSEVQDRIDTINAQLPEQREKSASSMRTLYKFQQSRGGLIDLVLSSEDFSSLLSTLQYLNIISDKNTDEITSLIELQDELEVAQTTLTAEKVEAEEARQKAEDALNAAEEARAEAEARAVEQAKEEEAARAAALAEAEKAEAEHKTFKTVNGNEVKVSSNAKQDGSTPAKVDHNTSAVETNGGNKKSNGSSSSDSVDSWAARIDAYLAGSPLAGQGRTFAEAALRYGVDPRWSPAISCIESSKGAACFKPHNAWGWGSCSWGSWEEAINAHVAGLASGYGYTISLSAAKKYCPPNYSFWYSCVSSEMASI